MIYYKDRVKMMRPILTREDYLSLRNGGAQKDILKAVRSGDESKKQKLLQMNYSCLPNEDGTLKGSTRMSSTIGMDIDHIPTEKMQMVMERILSKKDELGLLMMEQSARAQGYHLVFKRHPERSQEENLLWASELLGVEFDKGAKDITRVFFTTSNDELLFLDDEIFEVQVCEGTEVRVAANSTSYTLNATLTFRSIPYAKIIEEYWNRNGGMPAEGERNVKLHKLAVNLRSICDNKRETLLAVMPRLGLSEQELTSIVDSACKEAPKGFSKEIQSIVNDLAEPMANSQEPIAEIKLPPEMPKKLPKLIQLLISKEPEIYHPTVANAVFPALGAHFVGVNFPYIDNTLREATFMCCTMAPMSSGKSCVDRPVEHILADIKQRDQQNIDRENEWKDQCRTRGANKEKPKRPQGLCTQILDSDMTNAAFVQKLMDAAGKYLYVIVDEVELFYQLKTNGNKSIGKIFRLAFDNKPYGQVRVGVDSVSGSMPLRWNWNASTTIQRGQAFFRQMKADGTLSRIMFTTILTERGQDIPVHGIYDKAFDEQLKPYIDRLNAASGTIDCPQAKQLIKRMLEENRNIADLSDDELYERLSYRAVVIAWLKAMTLYVAEGQWSKQIEDFAVWSMHYDMWCKMNFFGEEMREQMRGETIRMKPGPQNMLSELPDEFSQEDAERMRVRHGKERSAVKMLYMWRQRGYVTLNPETRIYKKVKNK